MGKKKQDVQATGTAGAGTSWSHPLATETEDGARIVYVAVPNEDTLAFTQEHWARKKEQDPRVSAINAVIAAKQFAFDKEGGIDTLLRDAKKVEEFILHGTVPDVPQEGPAEEVEED